MFEAFTIKTTLHKKLSNNQECQDIRSNPLKDREPDIGKKLETSTLGEIVSLEKSNKNVNGLRILNILPVDVSLVFVIGLMGNGLCSNWKKSAKNQTISTQDQKSAAKARSIKKVATYCCGFTGLYDNYKAVFLPLSRLLDETRLHQGRSERGCSNILANGAAFA
nr:hypothetical protein [Tanacetum cinerariifolium]